MLCLFVQGASSTAKRSKYPTLCDAKGAQAMNTSWILSYFIFYPL